VRAVGITLTAAGLLAGISALVVAGVRDADKGTREARIADLPKRCDRSDKGRPYPCEQIDADIAARDRATTAAGALFAGSGVAAAATFLSVFLLPPTGPSGAQAGGLTVHFSPHAGPWGGGVSLEASW
jgi:hypothetical protein